MCMYCERRQDIKYGWEQPKLPYHAEDCSYNLTGNIANFDAFEGVIHDYKTCTPKLILTCQNFFTRGGTGTVYIPLKYCPECGRKLGGDIDT